MLQNLVQNFVINPNWFLKRKYLRIWVHETWSLCFQDMWLLPYKKLSNERSNIRMVPSAKSFMGIKTYLAKNCPFEESWIPEHRPLKKCWENFLNCSLGLKVSCPSTSQFSNTFWLKIQFCFLKKSGSSKSKNTKISTSNCHFRNLKLKSLEEYLTRRTNSISSKNWFIW